MNALIPVGVVVALVVLAPVPSDAGVRVDEPGPARAAKIPLPADSRRSANLQLTMGSVAVFALGFSGGGATYEATYERVRSPRTSWLVRASHGTAEDLRFVLSRTQELRDGRIQSIEGARVDAVELGRRLSAQGASSFFIDVIAGVSRTRLDGVKVWSSESDRFRVERRVRFQVVGGSTVGHLWQPVHFPLGVLAEVGWRMRLGPPSGGELSGRLGLLGQRASLPE